MLPKKNTSVATLALVFSLIAVPRAIAGSPLSLGSTLTQPAATSTFPVVRSHQSKGHNLMLKKPFEHLPATIKITPAQTNPNLPKNAQSQSGNGFWAILPILAVLGLVWGWYRSQSSQANNDPSTDQESDRDLTPLKTEQQLSGEVPVPQTVVSENKAETSEAATEVLGDTTTPAEQASPITDSATDLGATDQQFSNPGDLDQNVQVTETSDTVIAVTDLSDPPVDKINQDLTATTPTAAEDSEETTSTDPAEPPEISSTPSSQEELAAESTQPTPDAHQPEITAPEETVSPEPPKQSPVPSDPTPSFNEAQLRERTPSDIEAAKFNLGQTKPVEPQLASVDEGLAELPDGYGKTKIILMPREPNSAYAYWDIPNEDKEKLRKQGGEQLALRFYDVTGIDMDQQKPHSVRQYDCEEMTREWYIDVPISDRDYIVEIGYVTEEGHWLRLARSLHVRIPPVYPCDWYGDDFRTVNWEDNLRC